MLRRWVALAPDERVLLLAATSWVLAARIVVSAPGRSFAGKQRAMDQLARRLPRLRVTVAAARWAATAAARRIPGTACLAWAVALRGLLLQAGIESQLRIGVARDRGRPLQAHAWVECGGEPMSWNEPVANYGVLLQGGSP